MTTASEKTGLREAGKAVGPDAMPESLRRQARTCATSVPLPSLDAPVPVTERARAVRLLLARAADYLDRPGSLVHAQPPTFARAREQHHEAARRRAAVPLLAGARLAWGYFHLILIKPVLNFLEWVTETPLRFFAAVILCVIVWIWS
jgi:hypothetical protein